MSFASTYLFVCCVTTGPDLAGGGQGPSSLGVTKNSDQQSIISKSLYDVGYHTQSGTHISRTKKI